MSINPLSSGHSHACPCDIPNVPWNTALSCRRFQILNPYAHSSAKTTDQIVCEYPLNWEPLLNSLVVHSVISSFRSRFLSKQQVPVLRSDPFDTPLNQLPLSCLSSKAIMHILSESLRTRITTLWMTAFSTLWYDRDIPQSLYERKPYLSVAKEDTKRPLLILTHDKRAICNNRIIVV